MSNEKKQTPWELILGIATIIAALAFLAKIFGKSESEEEQAGQRSREDLYKKIKPSYEDFKYLDWANTLDEALMQNSTEDEDAVYSVFNRMKNISDVAKLIEFFGTKRKLFTTQYVTLPQAITVYFSKGEKQTLNKILAKKRIDYSFE
jgi:hypothetical protein